jgi:hypothetical protein
VLILRYFCAIFGLLSGTTSSPASHLVHRLQPCQQLERIRHDDPAVILAAPPSMLAPFCVDASGGLLALASLDSCRTLGNHSTKAKHTTLAPDHSGDNLVTYDSFRSAHFASLISETFFETITARCTSTCNTSQLCRPSPCEKKRVLSSPVRARTVAALTATLPSSVPFTFKKECVPVRWERELSDTDDTVHHFYCLIPHTGLLFAIQDWCVP